MFTWWQQGKGLLKVTLGILGGSTLNPGLPLSKPRVLCVYSTTITSSYFLDSYYVPGAVLSVSPLVSAHSSPSPHFTTEGPELPAVVLMPPSAAAPGTC